VSLAEDTNHDVWGDFFGPHPKLVRIENYKVQEQVTSPQFPGAYSVIADPHGGICLGLSDGRLVRYKNGEWHDIPLDRLNKKYGQSQTIFNMSFDGDGTLWGSATNGIIGYRDGKLQLLNERNGLPCDFSWSVVTDRHNDLWIQGQCGLMRIEHSELERWWANSESKLNVSTYAATDGFRMGAPVGRPAASRSNDGRLWFQNAAQAMMIDPDHVSDNAVIPPVHVQQVIADRTTYAAENGLRLPVKTRQLELDYTGLSYVMPSKVQFRYMLEGHDHQWQEPGIRRAAFYNDLAPGTYTFRVLASNNSGLWNTKGDALQFTIPPAYYQTTWFRLCCLAVFLLLLWAAYVFRVRQLASQFAAVLETRVDERTRIARELHDTLLQSFQGAVFQFQAARRLLLRNADNAMGVVDEAIQAAEEGITEGRSAIRDLRPEPAALRNLPELLNAACSELTTAQELNGLASNYQVLVEGKQRDLSSMLQDEVYRISREAIRNAFAHAAAVHIEVEIRYDQDQLRVRIRDDGKGIDPKILEDGGRPGHWGISGMRERAQRIGAQLAFWSEVGAGTEVQLTVPGAIAYEKHRDGHRFRLFRKADRDGQNF
jgi:signal transduction histidine kinase